MADSPETVARPPANPEQETVVLRKVAAAILAVPVLAILYLPVITRRSIAARLALLGSVGIVVAVAAIGLARPAPTTATPPSPPIRALPAEAFRSISTGLDLHAAVPIEFSEPMDPTSVAAALDVEPSTEVELRWSPDHRTVAVQPASHWQAGSYQIVTVQPGALAASGRPMAAVVRATFVTRPQTVGRIEATRPNDAGASPSSAFRLSFDRPVTTASVASAIRITPSVSGSLAAVPGPSDAKLSEGTTLVFTPDAGLAASTDYAVSLTGLVDLDGSPVRTPDFAVKTSSAPSVVRFRPANGTTKVDRGSVLSVRFTTPMAHGSTRAAFHVTANGKPVAGTVGFAESNRVLVFHPAKALPASASIVMSVDATATSLHGEALASAAKATVQTEAAPAAAAKAAARTTVHSSGSGSSSSGSGSAVGGGSWGAVETYYLRLMNCTRTGGWVTSTGSCSSPGGRSVAPHKLDAGISSRVSRPYAKKLAVNNMCTHFSGGNPGDRLRAAGYTSYRWAENLGCRSGNPYSAVLGSHLFFQSEKSYSGGHYVNLMNAAYDRCGIGVWVSGGRVRLVIDFYHPR